MPDNAIKLNARIERAKNLADNNYGTVDCTVKRLDIVVAQLDKLNFLLEKLVDLRGGREKA